MSARTPGIAVSDFKIDSTFLRATSLPRKPTVGASFRPSCPRASARTLRARSGRLMAETAPADTPHPTMIGFRPHLLSTYAEVTVLFANRQSDSVRYDKTRFRAGGYPMAPARPA